MENRYFLILIINFGLLLLISFNSSFSQEINLIKKGEEKYKEKYSVSTDSFSIKIAMLHIYPQLGQLQNNINLLTAMTQKALQNGANIVVAPELSTTGYSISALDVRNGLGLTAPFTSLNNIKNLSIQYNAYITIGIAEIGSNDSLYNSAVMFKPDGTFFLQRKRGLGGWNARGNLPFNVVPTKYGNIGIAICSDTYLMDWMRIMTINRADIILTPANWWGDAGQLNTWTTRAYENGIYMVVANRWGTEIDNRFNPPYTYNMNDAPSAVILPAPDYTIGPGNQVQSVYRAEQAPIPHDTVLYQVLKIPFSRIYTNQTWMLTARQTAAYPQIANRYYRPDMGNIPVPDLPPAGNINVGVMSYWQSTDPQVNLATIFSYWNTSLRAADVLILPSLGIALDPVNVTDPNWSNRSPWTDLQSFVLRNNIQLLVTSVFENYGSAYPNREMSIIIQPNKEIIAIPAIHGWARAFPNPIPPIYIDLDSARIGIILDRDILIPETALDLVKSGADLLVFPFDFGTASYKPDSVVSDNWPYNLLQTYSNIVCHIAGSNDYGMGGIVKNGGGFIEQFYTTNADQGNAFKIVKLNSAPVRTKYLNAYYDFDLDALLGYNYRGIIPTTFDTFSKNISKKIEEIKSGIIVKKGSKSKQTIFKVPRLSQDQLYEKRRLMLPPGTKYK